MMKMTWKQVTGWHTYTRCLFQDGKLSRQQIRVLESKWWWKPEIEDTSKKNKELILEMARRGDDRPSRKTTIGMMLPHYTKEKDKCYDEKFTMELRGLRPDWVLSRKDKRILRFREAVQWVVDHKRVPSCESNDSHERQYSLVIKKVRALKKGTCSGIFYPEYQKIIDEVGVHDLFESESRCYAAICRANNFFDWCIVNKRIPYRGSTDPVERRMSAWIARVRSVRKGIGKGVWYPEFLDIASQYGFPDIFDDKSGGWKNDARECFSFCQKIGRLPRKQGGNTEETKWGRWICERRAAKSGKGSTKWRPEYLNIATEYGFSNAFDPQPIGGAAHRDKPHNRTKAVRPNPVAKHHSVLKRYIQTGEMR